MKALYCRYCMTIAGLPRDASPVTCRCRASVRPNEYGARCRGRWVDPQRGTAIFTEIAQGGAEKDDLAPGGPYHSRGTAIAKPRALYVLGIHNTVLLYGDQSRLDHVLAARGAYRSLFAERESLIVRFRPGESSDTAYVTLSEFDAGAFPDPSLDHIPEELREYMRGAA